jgi:transposase
VTGRKREVLTDRVRVGLAPLLPTNGGSRGRPWGDHRRMLNDILWQRRTGAPWRDLPARYGPWGTCASRFARWRRNGTWDRVLAALRGRVGVERDELWEVRIDSTVVRAHQHAAGARHGTSREDTVVGVRHPLDEALGRSRGGLTSTIHLACNGHGRPLAVILTPGQRHDSTDTDCEVGTTPPSCLNSPSDAAESWRPYYATLTSPSVSKARKSQ